ncbi:hypothetical protein V6N13_072106 [Hibiscus sabdariffa]
MAMTEYASFEFEYALQALVTFGELWGVLSGLHLAWDKGFRRILVEVDNLDVVRALQEDRGQGHSYALILLIISLLFRCWEVRMIHVLRSGNSVMDNIAKLGILGSTCVIYFEVPPPSIVHVLLGDVDGVSDNIANLAILGSTCVIYFEVPPPSIFLR